LAKVSITSLTRRYPARGRGGEVAALGPVDLSLAEGEFVAIVGPSGCGKSTLLRLTAGLERPDDGAIEIAGAPVAGPVETCGMVFQQFALFPWLSVRRNIAFGISDTPDRDAIVDRLLSAVGLSDFADHYPASLSGGMQQRAALARALAREPEVLLLDEPFGALDQQTRGLMQEQLETLWREERRTVLLVTHDVDEALFLADRVLIMSARPGRILEEVEVTLPRPRDPGQRTSTEHSRLKARIGEVLRAEAMRAFSDASGSTRTCEGRPALPSSGHDPDHGIQRRHSMSDDGISMVDPATVATWLKTGEAVVVDVREPNEQAAEHIVGSVLNPLSQFDPAAVDTSAAHLVFHCQRGIRCGRAAEIMRAAGYTGPINRLEGGLLAWKADGRPVEPGNS